MILSETLQKISSGVFHIVFLDTQGLIVGRGTAFASCGFLITNCHVFDGHPNTTHVWIRRHGEILRQQGILLTWQDFRNRLKSASDKNNFDFAVLDIPERLKIGSVHQFELRKPHGFRMGDKIAFLGYPMEHLNLTSHTSVIPSFFKQLQTSD